jgi:hypothetical protein
LVVHVLALYGHRKIGQHTHRFLGVEGTASARQQSTHLVEKSIAFSRPAHHGE